MGRMTLSGPSLISILHHLVGVGRFLSQPSEFVGYRGFLSNTFLDSMIEEELQNAARKPTVMDSVASGHLYIIS